MTRLTAALLTLLALGGLAHAQGAPERFLLYRVELVDPAAAPVVDGSLDDAVWRSRATLGPLRNFLGPLAGDVATQRSDFMLVSDGQWLYIGADLHDDDMASVRCDPAKDPFWNDCVELYLDPRHDGTRSIQLVVDCGARRFWQKRSDDGYGWREDTSWHVLSRWEAAARRSEDRWSLELAIHCASFGIDPSPGRVCGFNACRFRLGSKQQEFSAWGFGKDQRQKDMGAWGHLLFSPAGSGPASGITRADALAVYPDLGTRVLELPAEAGFVQISAAGEKLVTYAEVLSPLTAAATEQLRLAQGALDALPDAAPGLSALRQRLPELKAESDRLFAQAAGPLTAGACDRTADALRQLRVQAEDLLWRAQLAGLVLRSHIA